MAGGSPARCSITRNMSLVGEPEIDIDIVEKDWLIAPPASVEFTPISIPQLAMYSSALGIPDSAGMEPVPQRAVAEFHDVPDIQGAVFVMGVPLQVGSVTVSEAPGETHPNPVI